MNDKEMAAIDALKAKEMELDGKLIEETDSLVRKKLIEEFVKCVTQELHDRPLVEFPSHWVWPNVATNPLTLETHLLGRLTLLDFFTYCCINCMHLLPDLEILETQFQDLLVIGVHSAKFDNERQSNNIKDAALRYGIHHPVVNDTEALLWKRLEIICWPTVVILDPAGKPLKFFIGEGKLEQMREFIQVATETFQELGQLHNKSKPELKTETSEAFDSVDALISGHHVSGEMLKYPGKVATDGDRLFIADTSHHRLVVAQVSSGKVDIVVGDGVRGFKDGPIGVARFNSPQGVCLKGPDELLVCDTGNHALRLVNLTSGHVQTLAGNGQRGSDLEGGRAGDQQLLSSPWDTCLGFSPGMWKRPAENRTQDVAYIAMAGSHQIWAFALEDVDWWKGQKFPKNSCFRVAGSGAEENRNNSYPAKAGFAQPSGITFEPMSGRIFVADSESSSVRCVSLVENGCVKGVVGGSKNPIDLFSFGDADGKGCDAKLQHPLAIALLIRSRECVIGETNGSDEDKEVVLFVADSYNHKLKLISDLNSKNPTCTTLELNGTNAELKEPGGMALSPDGSTLYICDTNHHRIKSVDTSTFVVTVVNLHITEEATSVASESEPDPDVVQVDIEINPEGGSVLLRIELELHPGDKLNPEAPSSWRLTDQTNIWMAIPEKSEAILEPKFDIELHHGSLNEGQVNKTKIKLNLFLCNATNGLCSMAKKVIQISTTASENSTQDVLKIVPLKV